MRQELVFVGEWDYETYGVPRAEPLPLAEKPKRIWTLFRHCDESDSPSLPFAPQHRVTAFLEAETHDWTWSRGVLKYGSRVADGPVWLLLEYAE